MRRVRVYDPQVGYEIALVESGRGIRRTSYLMCLRSSPLCKGQTGLHIPVFMWGICTLRIAIQDLVTSIRKCR